MSRYNKKERKNLQILRLQLRKGEGEEKEGGKEEKQEGEEDEEGFN